jgi:hypothetical protein
MRLSRSRSSRIPQQMTRASARRCSLLISIDHPHLVPFQLCVQDHHPHSELYTAPHLHWLLLRLRVCAVFCAAAATWNNAPVAVSTLFSATLGRILVLGRKLRMVTLGMCACCCCCCSHLEQCACCRQDHHALFSR